MLALVLPLFLTCAAAAPHAALYGGLAVLGPAYNAPILPVETAKLEPPPQGSVSYSVSNVQTPTGEVKQQTAIGKDARGGHTIRHSAQTSNLDPHSGQSDFKHDEHEFHINPFIGEAAVHTNNAQGSLNPTIGKAAFAQKTHQAKIAPGHSSVADVDETAAVSSAGSAASRNVNAARTDILLEGIAKNAHSSHKSYINLPGVAGESQAHEANVHTFDGHGYGNLHYDTQSAKQAYDALGHASASEAGYKLDQAYDTRINLGASNEVQYSRHAAHDPYGNYGSVTQAREASHGGQLVPVGPQVIVEEAPVVYKETSVVKAPVAYSNLKAPIAPAPVPPAPVALTPIAAGPGVPGSGAYNQPVVYGPHAYEPPYPLEGYYH